MYTPRFMVVMTMTGQRVHHMNLGVYISAEAALSYLGIGIQYPNISWA